LVAIDSGSMREMKSLDGSNLPLSASESFSYRDSLPLCVKNAHLALCRDIEALRRGLRSG
jgi:hypothetical protein